MTPEICTVCGEAIGGMKVYNDRTLLLVAVKAAYLKHHLNDLDIGWEELGEILKDTLCEVIGDREFVEWVDAYIEVESRKQSILIKGVGRKRRKIRDYLYEITKSKGGAK
jgi:hypothetical protein